MDIVIDMIVNPQTVMKLIRKPLIWIIPLSIVLTVGLISLDDDPPTPGSSFLQEFLCVLPTAIICIAILTGFIYACYSGVEEISR